VWVAPFLQVEFDVCSAQSE